MADADEIVNNSLFPEDDPDISHFTGNIHSAREIVTELLNYGLAAHQVESFGRWIIFNGSAYWAVDHAGRPLEPEFFRGQLEKFAAKFNIAGYRINVWASDKVNPLTKIKDSHFKFAVSKASVDLESQREYDPSKLTYDQYEEPGRFDFDWLNEGIPPEDDPEENIQRITSDPLEAAVLQAVALFRERLARGAASAERGDEIARDIAEEVASKMGYDYLGDKHEQILRALYDVCEEALPDDTYRYGESLGVPDPDSPDEFFLANPEGAATGYIITARSWTEFGPGGAEMCLYKPRRPSHEGGWYALSMHRDVNYRPKATIFTAASARAVLDKLNREDAMQPGNLRLKPGSAKIVPVGDATHALNITYMPESLEPGQDDVPEVDEPENVIPDYQEEPVLTTLRKLEFHSEYGHTVLAHLGSEELMPVWLKKYLSSTGQGETHYFKLTLEPWGGGVDITASCFFPKTRIYPRTGAFCRAGSQTALVNLINDLDRVMQENADLGSTPEQDQASVDRVLEHHMRLRRKIVAQESKALRC